MQRAGGLDPRKKNLFRDLLWKACCEGDYGMLQRLLEKYDEQRGRADVTELSVSPLFANINTHNQGMNALFAACGYGHHDCASLLLQKGANVNHVANDGISALFPACLSGHRACVSLLIDHGVNLNQVDNNGYNALFVASQEGHRDCASLLIDHGVNLNQVDSSGQSALFGACKGHRECVSLLLNFGINVNQVDSDGCNALFSACEDGHHACVSLLIDHGVNVNQKDKNKHSALLFSIVVVSVRCVLHLLENGAVVMQLDKEAAVVCNSVKCLALVLRAAGLEHINANNSGGKLLRLARQLKHSEIESFLLDNGATGDGTGSSYEPGLDEFIALCTNANKTARGERKLVRRCDYPGCDRDVPMEQLKKCKQCGEFWYCSKEHQLGHWKEHKAMCEKLRL